MTDDTADTTDTTDTTDTDDAPTYRHDCKGCTFLGFDKPKPGEHTNRVDVYIHYNPSGRHTTVRRFSSIPADYAARTDDTPKEGTKP